MTEQNVEHGQPGHVCGGDLAFVDATGSIAGVVIRVSDEDAEVLAVDSWANGISRADVGDLLRQLADSWDAEADEEYAAELEAAERARIAGLN